MWKTVLIRHKHINFVSIWCFTSFTRHFDVDHDEWVSHHTRKWSVKIASCASLLPLIRTHQPPWTREHATRTRHMHTPRCHHHMFIIIDVCKPPPPLPPRLPTYLTCFRMGLTGWPWLRSEGVGLGIFLPSKSRGHPVHAIQTCLLAKPKLNKWL